MNNTKLFTTLRESGLAKVVPKSIKAWIRGLGVTAIYQSEWEESYRAILARVEPSSLVTDCRVGIVYDWGLRHAYYEAACRELGVPYTIVDVTTSDWVNKVLADDSAIYLFRPFVLSSFGRAVYEERAFFMENNLKKNLFPRYEELWPYESKRRCANLLQLHNVPHPQTWVFFSREEARLFVQNARYPLVFKTDLGAEAYGVRIVGSPREGEAIVRQCFGKGIRSGPCDPRDRNYDQVLFQEYLADVKEWRVIRIGDSYFAYEKGKKGDFHSGSKVVLYGTPPEGLLEFSRQALDKMGLNCVAADILVDPAQRFFVNEIQAYYGANETNGLYFENGQRIFLEDNQTIEMRINGRAGRYFYSGGQWLFEEGDFSRNAGCNLRVKLAFQRLGKPLPGYRV